MPVFLTTSHGAARQPCALRCRIGAAQPGDHMPGLARALEAAFDAIQEDWLALAREMGAEPSAALAHTPAAAANASDFGLMLAWTRLVEAWAKGGDNIHLICDDPWMFRHLAGLAGVNAGPAPALASQAVKLWLRGYAARAVTALRNFKAQLALPRPALDAIAGKPVLLVYGHPASTAGGEDAYFGDLMARLPGLVRMLHVDCGVARARTLASPTTWSLHGFGTLSALPGLLFAKWRPAARYRNGPYGWLVRRAAAIEGGSGQGAQIAWQLACQRAWLGKARPAAVAWPWENHAWERAFVREAHVAGIATVGYQHTVVGRREWNYAAGSNPDGPASLPAMILTSGAEGRATLARWGVPADRIAVVGALRMRIFAKLRFERQAPLFVALPFDGAIAAEMVAAVRALGDRGHAFVVKDHPMTPFQFTSTPGVTRTETPLHEQGALAGVLYSATTVGLEALISGLPTLRFLPSAKVPVDVIPADIEIRSVTAEDLGAALESLAPPPAVSAERFFTAPDYAMWQRALIPGARA
jgi:hypothetical protein